MAVPPINGSNGDLKGDRALSSDQTSSVSDLGAHPASSSNTASADSVKRPLNLPLNEKQRTRIVVIGAGIGGLTAGALLAKRGYSV